MSKTRTERQREFGGVWLGNKLFEKLGLNEFFASCNRSGRETVDWQDIIKVLVLSRFCHPSRELYIDMDFLAIVRGMRFDIALQRGMKGG